MTDHLERFSAVKRRMGPTPAQREAIAAAGAEATDWRGRCSRCGEVVTGTRAEILAHICKGQGDGTGT